MKSEKVDLSGFVEKFNVFLVWLYVILFVKLVMNKLFVVKWVEVFWNWM